MAYPDPVTETSYADTSAITGAITNVELLEGDVPPEGATGQTTSVAYYGDGS